jgi:2-methylcitrate dehydratase PrpD
VNNHCRTLAEILSSVAFSDLPHGIIQKTKELILDSIGCMIGGTQLEQGQIVIDFFTDLGGVAEATVAARPDRVPALHAAYVNSYLANLLDYDDTYNGHPGATTVPPALAMADTVGASGIELLEAVIVGYEAGARVSEAIMRSRAQDQIVSGMTWQIFNAAAAAGKLLGLDADEMSHCLSLAAFNAPVPFTHGIGMRRGKGTWTKNNFGWFSMGGVMAALLAHRGFRGNEGIFNGDTGFWVMAGSDQFDPSKLTRELGAGYAVDRIHLKPYTACRYFHPALDALEAILRERSLLPQEIAGIDVATFYKLQDGFMFYPSDVFNAPISLPYALALRVLRVPAGYPYFNAERLDDPAVQEIAEKVHVSNWPEADERFTQGMRGGTREMIARVQLTLVSGEALTQEVRTPKGSPQYRLTDQELTDKFLSLAEPVLGPGKAEQIIDAVFRLDAIDNVQELTASLR